MLTGRISFAKRIKRLCFLLATSLLVVYLSFHLLLGGGFASDTEPRTYVVQPGDTLWTIAKAQGSSPSDPRPMVAQIKRLNNLSGALIHPGQTLLLPTP